MKTPSRFQENIGRRLTSPLHILNCHDRIKQMEQICRQ